MSPNSISKLFVGRFENESPASIGDEINQLNTENNNTKHLDSVQNMEIEDSIEVVEVRSNEEETGTYNPQIIVANTDENEANIDDNDDKTDEIVMNKNKTKIDEKQVVDQTYLNIGSIVTSTEEEQNINTIDNDVKVETDQKNGTKANQTTFTCKICGGKLYNSRPSITRSFYTTTRHSSVINSVKTSNLTKRKLKKFRFLLKHELLHTGSYKETRRLKFLLKGVREKQRKHLREIVANSDSDVSYPVILSNS